MSLDPSVAAIQLLEGAEYRFEWTPQCPWKVITVEPAEMFQPDSIDGRAGRLRPGLSTGTVKVQLFIDGEPSGSQDLEVRSRKLDYLSHYRWMLRDIANRATEILMDRFGAASATFSVDVSRDAVTLYEQFAFLRCLILSEELELALNEIIRRPHVAWVERHEQVTAGQGVRGDSYTMRQVVRKGNRVPWTAGPVSTIPRQLERRRTEATHDTAPNRFVRFVLERWRQVVSDIGSILEVQPSSSPIQRGCREVQQVLDFLDVALSHEVFREAGALRRFPGDDQVLQKREGYRDVFRAYLEFELAAKLSWPGGEKVYSAGQKDVATLYEYWAFLELAGVVAGLLGTTFDLSPLVELRRDRLNVTLREGHAQVLAGTVTRNGRKLALELWFNRRYSSGAADRQSWTMLMRPDYSLVIGPAADEPASFEPAILHFDAKYRVDVYRQLFGDQSEEIERAETGPPEGTSVRTDLLKMHAYRDAIRRSAGAYVLYPGTDETRTFVEYHELLPGLGAFPLRPTESGAAAGASNLRTFIDRVLDHLAVQITQHERGRYWIREAYQQYGNLRSRPPVATFVRAPPADTPVLLGYVKSKAHWEWIRSHGLYNLRGKGRRGSVEGRASLLACRLLVLSCPSLAISAIAKVTAEFESFTSEEMAALGYPGPIGSYLCAEIQFIDDVLWANRLATDRMEKLRGTKSSLAGDPVSLSWLELAVDADVQRS